MATVSISGVVACHRCPVRYYLERGMERTESERFTVAKQISYALGQPLDTKALWREVLAVSPGIDPAMEAECAAWVDACGQRTWHTAAEYDVPVESKELGIRGTVDRIFDDEPYFAIVRSSEAPAAGIYASDRIRIACFTVCMEETLGIRPNGGVVEYVPSGAARLCVPQPRDRRAALRALAAAHRIENGDVPRKPRNAPCERCHLEETCSAGARRLADLL
jgi:CRISPR-associated exonuclease Cas4